jgi:plasmid stabilization system protein ParE
VTRIRFHRAAGAEAEAAVRWYNERVTGLGDDFRAELTAAVERVAEGPLEWPISQYDPRTRRHLLLRFPYSIVYVVRADGDVTVAAVAHAKRKPGYWRNRV